MFWRVHARRIVAIWIFALLAYSNSFHGGMVFDNVSVIGRDTRIREATAANLNLILTQGYWFGRGEQNLYRPLTTVSYLFNYAVVGSGLNLASYHWVNFALHAANIALVYALALLLLGEAPLAFAAAALWAVHPVLTESVTNVVGRADLLAALGIMAGIACHIQAAGAAGKRRLAWLAALAIAAAVGVCSKETGVVLLAVMAIYDLTFRSGPTWRARAPGYVVAALPIAVFLTVRARVFAGAFNGLPFTDNPLVGADFWTARLTAIKVIGKYLLLLIWPAALSCDYSYNQVPLGGWSDWRALVSLAVLAGAAAAAVLCWRRAKPVSFSIAFFFVVLAPASNLVIPIGTIMAERFLYMPAIALAICAVVAWRAAGRHWPRVRPWGRALLVLVCAAMAVRTWARNSDWADNMSLWSSAVETSPNSYRTHRNLAASLEETARENREASVREAERALAILDPLPDERNAADAYSTAARAYRVVGDALTSPGEQAPWYRKALDAALRGRRINQAQSRLRRREIGTEAVYLELGRIYERLSQPREAIETLEYGLRVAGGAEICAELAGLYQANGEFGRAAVTYFEALALSPDSPGIPAKLVELYSRMDPGGCSLANGAMNLDCPLVRGHVCASARNLVEMYRKEEHKAEAETTETQAVRNFGCPADSFRN
jgi:tetratricopeptide (TPR) repeat protein